MKQKGQIWVSAVLYIALGMIVVTLILSAGIPLISKMRDRNTITQTKAVLFNIDKNIKAVSNEALGSVRYLSPVDINAGELYIDRLDSNKIEWSMKTNSKLIEPNTGFSEGNLHMILEETPIEDEYLMRLYLDYSDSNINISLSPASQFQNPFQGRFSFSIENKGYVSCATGECLEVTIDVAG